MTQIPPEWQTAFGGTALTGGCCNPPNIGAVNPSGMSWGPAAFVFNPDDLGTVNPVPATPVVYYSQSHPTLGSLEQSTTVNPAFNLMTEVNGVVFPRGTQSVLFFGKTGTSVPCFGNGTDNPALHRQPWPGGGSGAVYCYDPLEVNGGAGPHAYPYVYYVWAYDVQDFIDVKNGLKNPWDVMPYGQWTLTLPFDNARSISLGRRTIPRRDGSSFPSRSATTMGCR